VRRGVPGQDLPDSASCEQVRGACVRVSTPRWSQHPLYGMSAKVGARVLKWMGGRAGLIRRLPFARGWTEGRDMPAPEGRTFRELYRERQASRS
jgi:L-lactate utilization protein LutB